MKFSDALRYIMDSTSGIEVIDNVINALSERYKRNGYDYNRYRAEYNLLLALSVARDEYKKATRDRIPY